MNGCSVILGLILAIFIIILISVVFISIIAFLIKFWFIWIPILLLTIFIYKNK